MSFEDWYEKEIEPLFNWSGNFYKEDIKAAWDTQEIKIQELKKQLVEAQAACKVKDEALKNICVSVCYTEDRSFGERMGDINEVAKKALAIQPNSDALQTWYREQHGNYLEMCWKSMYEAKLGDKLYSPKEVKK